MSIEQASMDNDIIKWEEQVRNCVSCCLSASCTQAVCGNRCYTADIMLLGEAPGAEEDRAGIPFAGKAGSILDSFLLGTGIPREQLYIGNTVKCRPVKTGKRGGYVNRKPTRSEIAACRSHLLQELELVRPRLIVTLGATPLGCFMEHPPSMGDIHGRIFSYEPLAVEIFPMYHPAAVIYNRSLTIDYAEDMGKLKQYLLQHGLL